MAKDAAARRRAERRANDPAVKLREIEEAISRLERLEEWGKGPGKAVLAGVGLEGICLDAITGGREECEDWAYALKRGME